MDMVVMVVVVVVAVVLVVMMMMMIAYLLLPMLQRSWFQQNLQLRQRPLGSG